MVGHFKALLPFEAIEPISGNPRTVVAGETFSVDLDRQDGINITIVIGSNYLVVKERTFYACCQRVALRDGSFFDV